MFGGVSNMPLNYGYNISLSSTSYAMENSVVKAFAHKN